MKQSEYIKLSEREGIEDKDISKILDYLERQDKNFEYVEYYNETHFIKIGENIVIRIDPQDTDISRRINISEDEHYDSTIIIAPTYIIAENIMGIYGSLKKYLDK